MVAISSLWLAILLSAVIVFVVSAMVWMVLPHHKSDFKELPDEAGAVAAPTGTRPLTTSPRRRPPTIGERPS